MMFTQKQFIQILGLQEEKTVKVCPDAFFSRVGFSSGYLTLGSLTQVESIMGNTYILYLIYFWLESINTTYCMSKKYRPIFYSITYYIKWVTTSRAYSMRSRLSASHERNCPKPNPISFLTQSAEQEDGPLGEIMDPADDASIEGGEEHLLYQFFFISPKFQVRIFFFQIPISFLV